MPRAVLYLLLPLLLAVPSPALHAQSTPDAPTYRIGPKDLCELMERCQLGPVFRPSLTVEATDCAGNVSRDTVTSRGRISVRSCGAVFSRGPKKRD